MLVLWWQVFLLQIMILQMERSFLLLNILINFLFFYIVNILHQLSDEKFCIKQVVEIWPKSPKTPLKEIVFW